MSNNIFNAFDIIKVVLFYTNNTSIKKRVLVSPGYAEGKFLFFKGDAQFGLVKPKKNSPADVYIYTPDGVYKAVAKLIDTVSNLDGTFYKIEEPKAWSVLQFRSSTRKSVELSGALKFNDESEIEIKTCNLSETGFAFWSEEIISTLNQRFPCIVALEFPDVKNQADKVLITEASFVRSQDGGVERFDQQLYGLKFNQLNSSEQANLRSYLSELRGFY